MEDIVRRAKTPTKPKEAAPRDPNLVSAEEDLARRLGTKVRIEQNRAGKGRMLIEFYSNEELIRIYEAIAGS